MGRFLEEAKALRAPTPPVNCAQGVFVPFAKAYGLKEEDAMKIAANFKAGMRMGSVCGAVTGALMVLGLYGKDDSQTTAELYRRVKAHHEGCINCADLLRINKAQGHAQRPHCDAMVFECVGYLEEMLGTYENT